VEVYDIYRLRAGEWQTELVRVRMAFNDESFEQAMETAGFRLEEMIPVGKNNAMDDGAREYDEAIAAQDIMDHVNG